MTLERYIAAHGGKQLCVTSSICSSWDNQLYSRLADEGSYLLQIDRDTKRLNLRVPQVWEEGTI